ncbi:putative ubiquitin carboxyl-terminal hydrolase 16 [Cladorrhinum samala]|uniref:Ubiquitin carboxyl-terminal hydrolase n=1 Tax=Cladorrhinum samala TaxID=585594 RepID=A0AAV9HF85_9PEZI|nr:putative ubiquitin carboxyl-terminal hydrolase 16 [Cladorrhinum samala]
MPDKTLTVATYAAGASLAAITLVYVFGPTYFLDGNPSGPSASSDRKKGVVGLTNPANDCFINSVLQALAGLGDLRLYLIRETHRRSLDDDSVYSLVATPGTLPGDKLHFRSDTPAWMMQGFQRGLVTKSLKEILDALNERPIYKKTISATPFICAVEDAFRQRINRQQQDAQELLQVLAERLCYEYHAGRRARCFAVQTARAVNAEACKGGEGASEDGAGLQQEALPAATAQDEKEQDVVVANGAEEQDEEGFPMEGSTESQIECLTCGFKPRPTATTFCSLTLNVPQTSATTLVACFDGMFKTEYIDDFKCEKCRLVHAVSILESEARRSKSEAARDKAQAAISKLKVAIEEDPEKPPEDVALPDIGLAPKRRIARHVRLTSFPKILAVHLSRSIFDAQYSQKNSAKVFFPNDLMLGGIMNQKKYKLLAVVTHKGSHNSGHYETFRRQTVQRPFSNPSTFRTSEAYSRTASPAPNPKTKTSAHQSTQGDEEISEGASPTSGPDSLKPHLESVPAPASEPQDEDLASMIASGVRTEDPSPSGLRSVAATARSALSKVTSISSSRGAGHNEPSAQEVAADKSVTATKIPKRRKLPDRWWRISDDKVKEASTRDVLGMQREVYLLFYEMEKQG